MPNTPESALQDKAIPRNAPISSDRWVLNAALTIGFGLATILALELAEFYNLVGADNRWLLAADLLAGTIIAIALVKGATLALREMAERRVAAASARRAHDQIEILFEMAHMLQSATSHADANAVLIATATKLLPGFGGALYVFNNSGDRLDLSIAWDWPEGSEPPDSVAPAHCWALKRGKPHFNDGGEKTLHCEHHHPGIIALEIPMMARGEVHGMLKILNHGDRAKQRLHEAQPLAAAIADTMSLALSNIALREKLRSQALRDPLTGLYNRRYMEDVLGRYGNMAERNSGTLSAIMIDLDHFKRLNDEHGHALGDAVLSDVAAVMAAGLRPCDVACRYGGEELAVILPDCGFTDAIAKAEVLRERIESLSENRGIRVTASLGVATIPDTSAKSSELIGHADEALYRAKQEGRNRVEHAPRRRNPSFELLSIGEQAGRAGL